MKKKLIIIEDDNSIQLGLKDAFGSEGFEVTAFSSGIDGEKAVLLKNPDILLLDLILPDINGLDICRNLRADGVTMPIIMLTSKKDEIDKIIGLEIGADDYITKPFSIRELIARVHAHLRRADVVKKNDVKVTFADIEIDFRKLEIFKKGEKINLSAKEFQILKYFIEKEGRVITREMLLDDVWGYDSFPTTRTVDNYILNLRKNIEDDHSNPKHILTVHTLGYKFII